MLYSTPFAESVSREAHTVSHSLTQVKKDALYCYNYCKCEMSSTTVSLMCSEGWGVSKSV